MGVKFESLDEIREALKSSTALEEWLQELIATGADIHFEPHSIYYCPIGKFINQNHEFPIFEVGRNTISDDNSELFLPEWCVMYIGELNQLTPDIPINTHQAYEVLESVIGQMLINEFLSA